MEVSFTPALSVPLTPSPEPDQISGTPAIFHTDMAGPSQCPGHLEDDLRAMLQALNTKSDIETLILHIEEAHSRAIQEVKAELHPLSDRMDSGEASVSSLANRVTDLERSQASLANTAVDMRLHLEDLEDRSRRNNLLLWGLPEATGAEDLAATVRAIFHKIMEALLPP